ISYKLIDKNKGPGTASRAMVVQSRVLEFYRQYDFDDKIVEAGIPIQHFNVYKDKRLVGKLPIAKKGKDVSPYPYVLT
ncbi:monooxygenase, partial [Staphylococcus epidermidis]